MYLKIHGWKGVFYFENLSEKDSSLFEKDSDDIEKFLGIVSIYHFKQYFVTFSAISEVYSNVKKY